MSEKTLTKEIAEQFLADPKRYSSRPSLQELEGFTEIADAAAEVLSKWDGVICGLPAKEWVESLKG